MWLRPNCVGAVLNEGLDLLDMLGSQLAGEVRHACRGKQFIEQDFSEILDDVLVHIAKIAHRAAVGFTPLRLNCRRSACTSARICRAAKEVGSTVMSSANAPVAVTESTAAKAMV